MSEETFRGQIFTFIITKLVVVINGRRMVLMSFSRGLKRRRQKIKEKEKRLKQKKEREKWLKQKQEEKPEYRAPKTSMSSAANRMKLFSMMGIMAMVSRSDY